MISVRRQLLPTGLISMLSYFLGLMYSEVVLAHLQLRFPFTSRMAERERRWQLTGTDRLTGMQHPRSQRKFPFPCFHCRDHGEKLLPEHLPRFPAPTLLPKAEPKPCKGWLCFFPGKQQGKPSPSRQEDAKLPCGSGRRVMPAKAPGAHLHGQGGTSAAGAGAARGAGALPSSGKAQPRRCWAGAQTALFIRAGHAPTQAPSSHLSSHSRPAETHRGDVISQMLPTDSPEAQ